MFERRQVPRREIARERDRVRFEFFTGHRFTNDAERVGLLAGDILAAERDQRQLLHRQA